MVWAILPSVMIGHNQRLKYLTGWIYRFLGPICRHYDHRCMHYANFSRLLLNMPFDTSTGWSTVAMSMYQQCTIRAGVTGIHMALWVDIDMILAYPDILMSCCLKNWRAALAVLVSVPPNMPGLINAINPKIDVGRGSLVYNFAWLFGVSAFIFFLTKSTHAHFSLLRRQ